MTANRRGRHPSYDVINPANAAIPASSNSEHTQPNALRRDRHGDAGFSKGIRSLSLPSVRLVLAWMRQRPRVLEHLAEVAHVDPAIAGRAASEMFGLVLGLFANALPDDFAASNGHVADNRGPPTSR
jgi:hypothetical protein